MNLVKELKNKTWIDWVKIVVAIDIASAGIGLIINIHLHVIANILGFITRISLGILYIILATLIFKRVFLANMHIRDIDDISSKEIKKDAKKYFKYTKKIIKKIVRSVEKISDNIIYKIDNFLDKVELFFKNRRKEIKKEIHNIKHKKD